MSRSWIFAPSSERNRPILASVSVLRLMTVHRLERSDAAVAGAERIERTLRLATGLIIFAFATSHLVNHAFGIRSVAAMDAASAVLLAPWQTTPGLFVLYASFFVHGLLGLYALYRRRHLRIPAADMWQLALGLAIPVLLISHAASIRLGTSIYEREFGYARVLYQFWVASPDFALPRQLLLLLIVWIYGCIGLRSWLRSKPWYSRVAAVLGSLAILVPVVAILGFVTAGFDLREAVRHDPAYAASIAPSSSGAQAQNIASVQRMVDGLTLGYLALVLATLALRAGRDWRANRFGALRITYPGNRMCLCRSVSPCWRLAGGRALRMRRSAAVVADAPPAGFASARARMRWRRPVRWSAPPCAGSALPPTCGWRVR